MKFSVVISLASALTVLSMTFAALTPSEIEAYRSSPEGAGEGANLCPPCLQKAMNNHFPHACRRDLDHNAANFRSQGANSEEERCVCVAFNNLDWMKKDCSVECLYVHNEEAMGHFLPASKIEGCENWLDFETGEEKKVEGFPEKNLDHVPEVYEIVIPEKKELAEGEEPEDDGAVPRMSVTMTFADDDKERAALEIEAQAKKAAEGKKSTDSKETKEPQQQQQQAEKQQTPIEAQAEPITKEEL